MKFFDWLSDLFASKPVIVIVNGLKYDLSQSTMIHSYVRGWGDMYYGGEYYDALWKGPNGGYFTYGDTRGSGMRIQALSDKDARKWCEENVPVHVYERLFGEVKQA